MHSVTELNARLARANADKEAVEVKKSDRKGTVNRETETETTETQRKRQRTERD